MFDNVVVDRFIGQYSWLSNFHFSPITTPTCTISTVEHGYQAAKATNKVDFLKIIAAPTPGAAKRLGKTIKIRKDWESIKIGVMLELLRLKFVDPTLRQLLLDTGDAKLIEGNWWGDKFWGVCNGEGRNMLGTLLMNVREELRNV